MRLFRETLERPPEDALHDAELCAAWQRAIQELTESPHQLTRLIGVERAHTDREPLKQRDEVLSLRCRRELMLGGSL